MPSNFFCYRVYSGKNVLIHRIFCGEYIANAENPAHNLRMKSGDSKYIWQSHDWPNWQYDIAALAEQAVQAAAVVFQTGQLTVYAETHIGIAPGHAQSVKQTAQVWIVLFVVDDESGIDIDQPVLLTDGDGIGVSTDIVIRLEYMYIVFAM